MNTGIIKHNIKRLLPRILGVIATIVVSWSVFGVIEKEIIPVLSPEQSEFIPMMKFMFTAMMTIVVIAIMMQTWRERITTNSILEKLRGPE